MGKKTLTRLLFAAGISLACFAGTYIWYHSSGADQQRGNGQKPIAYAERTKDEIHRRPVTRIIWQLVNDGEPLYPGEAIRTSQNGEVRIQFSDSEKYIDLEPDSLIVISQANNEISLDLMDGSFMVAQNNEGSDSSKGGPSLTLNSQNGKVDLSKATASLSKSNGGNIDLQVLKGKATIQSNGQSKDIEQGKSGALGAKGVALNQDNLKIISPSIDKVTYINPETLEPVTFRWTGFPAEAVVTLQTSPNQKTLKSQGETTTGLISLKMPAGKHYWKLVAKDKNGKALGESPIYRLEVAARFAPASIAPEQNAQVVKASNNEGLTFKWTRAPDMDSVLIEVAKDPLFKAIAYSSRFKSEEEANVNLPIGDYFWRLSAAYPDSAKQITGKTHRFFLGPARPRVTIGWLNPEEKTPQYFVEQPMASLGWLSEQKAQVKTWRLRLAMNEGDLQSSGAQTVDTKDLSAKTKVLKPGRYIAMVEAMDDKDRVIASSPTKSIEVAPLPLLPGPKFAPESGELKADNQGKLDLKWNSINGAKEYQVTLLNAEGKELKTAKFNKNSTVLVNLFPGQYKIQIAAVDQYGRVGEKEEPRSVVVPEGSGLNAPKLKKIKVN